MIPILLLAAAVSDSAISFRCEPEGALGREPGVTEISQLKSVTITRRDMREAKFDMTLDLNGRSATIKADPDVFGLAGNRAIVDYKPIPIKNSDGHLVTFALLGRDDPALGCSPGDGDACRTVLRVSAYDFDGKIDFNIDPPARSQDKKGPARLARIVGECERTNG